MEITEAKLLMTLMTKDMHLDVPGRTAAIEELREFVRSQRKTAKASVDLRRKEKAEARKIRRRSRARSKE